MQQVSPVARKAMRPLALLAAAVLPLLVAGCGSNAGTAATSVTAAVTRGIVHGGPNPITGATVTLYVTNVSSASSYPTAANISTAANAATVVASTTSDGSGSFNFATFTCPTTPMQYAYITIVDGNTGSNTGGNPNSVLFGALGSCANLGTANQATANIYISEATTVAAGYALANFINVSGAAGAQVVNIGSTLTNDATTPGCTGSGAALVCTAGGLGHAFDNALQLVNSVSLAGNPTTGLFNPSMPGYSGSLIPVAMLNVVADALQQCVNSAGGASGDGSSCGTLFADTKNAGTAPTDTLTASVNLAKFPSNSAATNATAGLFSLDVPTSYFGPTLSAAPTDYSLGIFYPGSTNFPYVYSLTLDISDNVFLLAQNIPVSSTATATGTGLAAITYNANGQNALLYGYTANSAYTTPGTLAVDSNDNVYASNPSLATYAIRQFAGASGAQSSAINPMTGTTAIPYGDALAVDKSNNLWMATALAGVAGSGIYEVPASGAITYYSTTDLQAQDELTNIGIDAYGNIWSCSLGHTANATSTGQRNVFLPGASATTPPVPFSLASPTLSTKNGGGGFSKGNLGSSVTFDSSGNVYCPLRGAVSQENPGASDSAPTTTPYEQTYASAGIANSPSGGEVDGANVYFVTGNSAIGQLFALPVTATATSANTVFAPAAPTTFNPCYQVQSGSNFYCSNSTSSGLANPYALLAWSSALQIDSTGAAWIGVQNNTAAFGPAGIVQLIGPAAPVSPQLSYAEFGVKP